MVKLQWTLKCPNGVFARYYCSNVSANTGKSLRPLACLAGKKDPMGPAGHCRREDIGGAGGRASSAECILYFFMHRLVPMGSGKG